MAVAQSNGTALETRNGAAANIIEQVIIKGDLAQLSPPERVSYYREVCRSLGLNELTRPFEYINLNGRLTLYARKDCTDQLRATRGVNITKLERDYLGDLYAVTAYATNEKGRQDSAIGAVSIAGLKGEALANALMKAETKAKRRVTLSLCGLGWTDESEVESVPSARTIVVDSTTGEILEERGGSPPPQPAPPGQPAAKPARTVMLTSADEPMWQRWLELKSEAEGLGVVVPELRLPIAPQLLQAEGIKVREAKDKRREQLAREEAQRGETMVTSKDHPLWQDWLEAERTLRNARIELDTSSVHLPISEASLRSSIQLAQEALNNATAADLEETPF